MWDIHCRVLCVGGVCVCEREESVCVKEKNTEGERERQREMKSKREGFRVLAAGFKGVGFIVSGLSLRIWHRRLRVYAQGV